MSFISWSLHAHEAGNVPSSFFWIKKLKIRRNTAFEVGSTIIPIFQTRKARLDFSSHVQEVKNLENTQGHQDFLAKF